MGLRVGVIQSVYAPWRGYFDLMDDVDVFVLYDDVQYSKNSWTHVPPFRQVILQRCGGKSLVVVASVQLDGTSIPLLIIRRKQITNKEIHLSSGPK